MVTLALKQAEECKIIEAVGKFQKFTKVRSICIVDLIT